MFTLKIREFLPVQYYLYLVGIMFEKKLYKFKEKSYNHGF